VAAATDCAARGAQQEQDCSDNDEDDAERPEDRDFGDESDEQQNNAKNYHEGASSRRMLTLVWGALRRIRARAVGE
jgi:hypothetical protein